MNYKELEDKTLDKIIDDMTSTVEKSKDEIFHLSEDAIQELEHLKKELIRTKIKVKDIIRKADKLEEDVQKSRKHLSAVSSQFNRYSENDIREVYENTHKLQTDLAVIRQEEKVYREKRDDLERRIVRLENTIEHADNLGRKVSVVLNYLYDDFTHVNELLKNAKEKQEFGFKIIETQELERKRLSREIHDGPAQMLANALIRSELIDLSYRQGNTEQALTEIKQMRSSLHLSLKEVRRIIYDLRPMALDDLGLIPTMKKYVAKESKYHNIHIDFTFFGNEKRLDSNYEVAVFRLTQEAIQNALKHSQAKLIKVKMEILQDKITVFIKDDGVGFNPSEKRPNSFGLVGMKERVEILKGDISVVSKLGHGTTIKFVIPFNKD